MRSKEKLVENFAQLLFCHREERKRRGDLFKYQ